MGLPELTFELEKAAGTVAARVSTGIVGMILRDSKANGLHTIYREGDIPAELGADNKAAVQRVLMGYINKPQRIYLSVIGTEDDIVTKGFNQLVSSTHDYLVGPLDLAAADAKKLGDAVKEQRKKRYIGKVVLPDTAGDNEGIINFTATGIKVGETGYTAAQYAGRVAGMLAGTPVDCSATYAAMSEVTAVDAQDDADAAVEAGKLILLDDGRQIKLGRAVTSKTTLSTDEPELLKKIKMVAAVDLIRYYAITTVEDEYLGKCANTYDNKCILVNALGEYMTTLENQGVILSGSSTVELDAQTIREWLIEQAEADGDTEELDRVRALDDDALRREDTGSHVFLLIQGKVLDAMEDFHIVLEAQ